MFRRHTYQVIRTIYVSETHISSNKNYIYMFRRHTYQVIRNIYVPETHILSNKNYKCFGDTHIK